MNPQTNQAPFDLSFYIKKYLIPLWERKWLVIGIFCLGIILSFFVSSFIKSEFTSSTTLYIEKPTTEMTKIEKEEVEPETASGPYVASQATKLRSLSMASEVLNILPQTAKSDLLSHTATESQVLNGFLDMIGETFGKGYQKKLTKLLGIKPEEITLRKIMLRRQNELQNRLTVITHKRTSMIEISATSFQRDIGPMILQAYLDVYLASNLEENKESVRSKRQFISKQREKAYQAYKKAEQDMIDYRKSYGIPGDFEKARDIEIQLKLNRLESQLKMARERYKNMDQMYMEIQEKEAGITNNVKVLEQPTFPTSASKAKIYYLRNLIILIGLGLGIAIVLGLDFIKAPLRHEKDIQSAVQIPIIGTLPQIKK